MGACFSIRTPKYIIGDISSLSPSEQKLYGFSKYVFVKNEIAVQEVEQTFGQNILGLKYIDENGGGAKSNLKSGNNTLTQTDDNIVSDSCIDIGDSLMEEEHREETNESLFSLLVTDKPFWYSQSFCRWKRYYDYQTCFRYCQMVKETIYIQPIDNFPPFIRDFEIKLNSFRDHLTFFTLLQTVAEAFFDGMNVRILPSVHLLDSGWKVKSRVHEKTGQRQLFVTDFHPCLNKSLPKDGYCIMGISWTDLYPTEDLNFILGEANNNLRSGIFCFGRFEPKTYEHDTHRDLSEVDGKLLWQILKVFTHELCHLFAMEHCWYFACAMNESNSMAEAFSQPLFLCPVCLRKLQHVCQFNVTTRYEKLLRVLRDLSQYYPSEQCQDAVLWLENCLDFMCRH